MGLIGSEFTLEKVLEYYGVEHQNMTKPEKVEVARNYIYVEK